MLDGYFYEYLLQSVCNQIMIMKAREIWEILRSHINRQARNFCCSLYNISIQSVLEWNDEINCYFEVFHHLPIKKLKERDPKQIYHNF